MCALEASRLARPTVVAVCSVCKYAVSDVGGSTAVFEFESGWFLVYLLNRMAVVTLTWKLTCELRSLFKMLNGECYMVNGVNVEVNVGEEL